MTWNYVNINADVVLQKVLKDPYHFKGIQYVLLNYKYITTCSQYMSIEHSITRRTN